VQVVEDNLIVAVELSVTGIDAATSASTSYNCNLVRGDSFVPYEQLTEQQVLDWCFAPKVNTWVDVDGVERSVIKHLKNEGEAQVTRQIEQKLAEKQSELALPWAN
jgi:hypothetical protein